MTKSLIGNTLDHSKREVEFDLLADDYRNLHMASLTITGESPEYFSEYKVADVAELLRRLRAPRMKILDFGCGIGNALPTLKSIFLTVI